MVHNELIVDSWWPIGTHSGIIVAHRLAHNGFIEVHKLAHNGS